MKGVVNVEFVISTVVFIISIAFVSMMVINNMPFMHNEAATDHLKSKAYQISHVLLFDEGSPSSWDETDVSRIGLSSGNAYELNSSKIANLNELCISNSKRVDEIFGELGLYVGINITEVDTGLELTPDCVSRRTDVKFTITRFAVIDKAGIPSSIVRVTISLSGIPSLLN